jgi:hypothetical protein
MVDRNLGDQRAWKVAEIPLPILPHPRKLILEPDPEAEGVTADMVLLSHVRKVEISNGIILIKTDEKLAIPNRDISRHAVSSTTLFFNGVATRISISLFL